MKRQFVLNMLDGANPSLDDMGGRTGMTRKVFNAGKNRMSKNKDSKSKSSNKGRNKSINNTGATKTGINKTGNSIKNSARNGFDGIKNKTKQAKDYIGQVQKGEIPNYQNPYTNESENQNTKHSHSNGRKSNNVNVSGENVSVTKGTSKASNPSESMRNPKVATMSKTSQIPKKQLGKKQVKTSKNQISATKTRTLKSNSSKPITQWEAKQQIKSNKNARNPYQHFNDRNINYLNKDYQSRFKSIQSNKE